MPLPTSGPINAANFNDEFGQPGTGEISFSEMYRGGPFVDAQTSSTVNQIQLGPVEGPFLSPGTFGWIVQWDPRNLSANALFWNGVVVVTVTLGGLLFTPFTVNSGSFQYGVGNWSGVDEVDGGGRTNRWYPVTRRTRTTVPVTTFTNVNTQVPTTGPISLQNLRGARNF
jgi:hypothetical protein